MAIWAVVVAGLLFGVPPPEEVRRAVREAFEEPGLQREWPGGVLGRPGSGDGEDGERADPSRDPGPGRPRPPGAPRDPERLPSPRGRTGGSETGRALLWVAAIAAVLLLTALYLRGRQPAQPDVRLGSGGEVPEPLAPAVPPPSLDEAEALARQGRFAEAVHVLLRGAFARLDLAMPLAASWTSRETLAHLRLPESARGACATLVGVVEVSRFGGRPVGEADYARARAAHDQVVASTGEPA